MKRDMMKYLAIAAAGLIMSLFAAPAFAASCWNTGYPSGTVVYDDGAGNCYRAVVNSDGTLATGPAVSRTPNGYQQITSLATATALTIPTGTTTAVVTVEGQNVRLRDDGVNPTSSIGFPWNVGSVFVLSGAALTAAKFIEQVSGGEIDVLYYK